MRRILVAVDDSDCARKAVQYCADLFSGLDDVSFTLFHVAPYMPPQMWDIGHILSEREQADRQAMIDRWFDNQVRQADPLFESAAAILLQAGFDPERIETKVISDSADVAGSIIEEARTGHYITLVMGRSGSSGIKELFLGSTSSRIINRGAGLGICLVE
jgi:nucleotide-binding universal stress UspA family protein